MIPGEVDQYRNVTVGSCILAQPAIWSLICVTDTFCEPPISVAGGLFPGTILSLAI